MSDLKRPLKPDPNAKKDSTPKRKLGRPRKIRIEETGAKEIEPLNSKGNDETSSSKGSEKNKPSCSNQPPNNEPSSSNGGSEEPSSAKEHVHQKIFRKFASKRPNRLQADKWGPRYDILLKDEAPELGPKDLVPNGNFVVSFRVHEPYLHRDERDPIRPGRCMQEITCLEGQPLTALKDMIICAADFQDVRGDISDRPESPVTVRARDMYPSSMFYFDNAFYVDQRSDEAIDYSIQIREWAYDRGIRVGKKKSMHKARVEDLTIRFGYPYLYMHQGNCEHIIVISDARLVSPYDNLHSASYPLMTKMTTFNCTLCMTCAAHPARWIIRDCDRLTHDPTYQCDRCFLEFHYVDGNKMGNFKAYRFWQKSII